MKIGGTHRSTLLIKRYVIERDEDWHDWANKIPTIEFPSNWKISIIPPFGGAMARFRVSRDGKQGDVSVYLDVFDRLGSFGSPYWEVYPIDDDVGRCSMLNVGRLKRLISRGLQQLPKAGVDISDTKFEKPSEKMKRLLGV